MTRHIGIMGAASCLVLVLLAGCTVGPDYHAPDLDQGKGWSAPVDTAAIHSTPWWQDLHDPVLNQLVQLALEKNPDIQASQSRIVEARAARDAAFAQLMPQASLGGGVDVLRQSENGPLPLAKIPFIPRDETIRDVEFDASWDADLFGGKRRTMQSAQAQQQAAIATTQDLRMSLIAELVRDYVALRGEQRELQSMQQQLALYQQNEDAVAARVKAGDMPQSALDQAVLATDNVSAQLPALTASLRALAFSVGILTGRPPEQGLALLDNLGQFPALEPVPVGQRADVLRRRPDVRVAERKLAAATANIGVAKSAWFPQLTINASAGFQSLEPGNWFTMPSQTGSVFPFISWRILDGGRIQAQVHAAKAQQQEAAHAYVAAVLGALADAERALSDYQHALDTHQREQAALQAAQRADDHAARSFASGETTRQDRLTSQWALVQTQLAEQQAATQAAIDWVALNKALALPVE